MEGVGDEESIGTVVLMTYDFGKLMGYVGTRNDLDDCSL